MQQNLIYEIIGKKEKIKREFLLNKSLLVPYIFGQKEFDVLIKLLEGKEINPTERGYLSRSIKYKLKAAELLALTEIEKEFPKVSEIQILEPRFNYFFRGAEYAKLNPQSLNERVNIASSILNKIEKQFFSDELYIVGSFLFKEKYNDIDVLILGNKDEEIKQDNLHLIFLPKNNMEKSHFFHSVTQISITNNFKKRDIKINKNFKDVYALYQEIIIGLIEKNIPEKELRDYFILCEFLINNKIINSIELDIILYRFSKSVEKIRFINDYCIKVLKKDYKKTKSFIKERIYINNSLIKEYKKNEHLIIFNKMLNKVSNGRNN